MSENLTWWQQLNNRWYAIPAVAQWWARRAAQQLQPLTADDVAIPFARLTKPLSQCRAALVTTAGVHMRSQPPFDMQNPDGDASYRAIPAAAAAEALTITHKYYDHSDADRDLNVVFPLAHLRDLVRQGVIGGLAAQQFGFMGHIEGQQLAVLQNKTAPEVAARLRQSGADFVLLTPA